MPNEPIDPDATARMIEEYRLGLRRYLSLVGLDKPIKPWKDSDDSRPDDEPDQPFIVGPK